MIDSPSSVDALLRVADLVVEYGARAATVRAVDGVSFDVRRGETLGVVGESGCGKTSVAKALVGLQRATSGSIHVADRQVNASPPPTRDWLAKRVQMIFQDPISSLNPRRRVRDIVAEGLIARGQRGDDVTAAVERILAEVGLDPADVADRRPGEFSGGQCQRISIARALVLQPELLVCDEPVSALDVSVQAQIINLLAEMKRRYDLTLVVIAHDLAVVKNMSDRVMVMYLGKVCELGPADDVFARAAHHYTALLIDSVPEAARPVAGDSRTAAEMPSLFDPPSGCAFRTRCPAAQPVCAETPPPLRAIGREHAVACHFPATSPVGVGRRP